MLPCQPLYLPFRRRPAESLAGLAVIRSFGMKGLVMERFLRAQDANSRAYWAFLVTSRWLGLRLDVLCICLLAAASLAAAGSRRQPLDPGLVGLTLTQLISLISGFQWCVSDGRLSSSESAFCRLPVSRNFDSGDP